MYYVINILLARLSLALEIFLQANKKVGKKTNPDIILNCYKIDTQITIPPPIFHL